MSTEFEIGESVYVDLAPIEAYLSGVVADRVRDILSRNTGPVVRYLIDFGSECEPVSVEAWRVSGGRESPGAERTADDAVSHPAHYTSHPSGLECIQVTEHMGFTLGNAVKYIWRADLKNDAIEDLKKACWYIQREIAKREAAR